MADFVTTHRLTHKASLKMMEAGVAKAEALGCKVSLAVVDQSCRLSRTSKWRKRRWWRWLCKPNLHAGARASRISSRAARTALMMF